MMISLQCDIKSSQLKILMIWGLSSCLLLNKTESESENIINSLCLLFEMMSNAKSRARASAVNMEVSIGRDFLIIILFRTAAHCPWSHQ